MNIINSHHHFRMQTHHHQHSAAQQLWLSPITEKMSGNRLAQQLKNFTSGLREQGILDHRFDQLKELEDDTPGLVMEVIPMALRDADSAIKELTRTLNKHVVDYPKVSEVAHTIKGISGSVGGCRVVTACVQLREVTDTNNKERCLAVFDAVKREYSVLRENLNHILQMERAINANEPKRPRQ